MQTSVIFIQTKGRLKKQKKKKSREGIAAICVGISLYNKASLIFLWRL